MNFASDNVTGASAQVLRAVVEANEGPAATYGADRWSVTATERLAEIFEHDVTVALVTTGTAANSLALSLMVQPWQAIVCHRQAHVAVDESTAPELFTGGARIVTVPERDAKLQPDALLRLLERHPQDPPHNNKIAALSLTQATESGLCYAPDEVAELSRIAREHGLRVHMDGARFSNALVRQRCSPAELSWKAGVDIVCLGASKNGALAAEAVIVFDPALAASLEQRRKRVGHTIAKSRLVGAQLAGWLEGDHWLALARHANAMADRLANVIRRMPGTRLAWPVQANELFVILPQSLDRRLRAAGAIYYDWYVDGLPDGREPAPDESFIRLVTSFATKAEEVDAFAHAAGVNG